MKLKKSLLYLVLITSAAPIFAMENCEITEEIARKKIDEFVQQKTCTFDQFTHTMFCEHEYGRLLEMYKKVVPSDNKLLKMFAWHHGKAKKNTTYEIPKLWEDTTTKENCVQLLVTALKASQVVKNSGEQESELAAKQLQNALFNFRNTRVLDQIALLNSAWGRSDEHPERIFIPSRKKDQQTPEYVKEVFEENRDIDPQDKVNKKHFVTNRISNYITIQFLRNLIQEQFNGSIGAKTKELCPMLLDTFDPEKDYRVTYKIDEE